MVQTEVPQLLKECNNWRESLHSYRDEFNNIKLKLTKAANKSLSKEQFSQLDHYQNLLHIQLINIHDLKQSVKAHDRQVNYEIASDNNPLSDDALAHHEQLYDQYQSLNNILEDLRSNVNEFINRLQ